MIKCALPVLALTFLTACAPTRVFIKTYEGAPLGPEQSALLKPFIGVQIKSIDGDTSKAITPLRVGMPTNLDADISFIPGLHSIVLGYQLLHYRKTVYSIKDQTVQFEAKAGHRYLLRVEELGDFWKPIIEDVTQHPERWSSSDWDMKSGPSKPIPHEDIH
jgi:hypothetical protein